MLRQNYFCAQSRAVGTVAAFSNAIEPVAGSDDPGIGGGALQVLAEIFEDGRMFGRKGSKIVDGFVDTSRQAGDRKSTRLNSSHLVISYAVFCLKKKKKKNTYELRLETAPH